MAKTRLAPAIEWLLAKQDARGRWRNVYAYTGKTWVDIERQGQPSKRVTLRSCRVLRYRDSWRAGSAAGSAAMSE